MNLYSFYSQHYYYYYYYYLARMGEERECMGSWWGNRREGDHWGDLSVDGWKILGCIFGKWNVRTYT